MESTALTLPARAAIALQSTAAEDRRIAERLEMINRLCRRLEYWQLDEVIIAIDELLAKWVGEQ